MMERRYLQEKTVVRTVRIVVEMKQRLISEVRRQFEGKVGITTNIAAIRRYYPRWNGGNRVSQCDDNQP